MATGDWDAYWRGASLAPAVKDSGPQDEALKRFWYQCFKQVFANFHSPPQILDVACGSGAVIRHALALRQNGMLDTGSRIFGLDTSVTALRSIVKRHPDIHCVVANGGVMPFPDCTFDLVTSQFGIEYAGIEAMHEASRVVRPGGFITTVLHLHEGAIYKECKANLEAINEIHRSGLLRCFESIFRTAQAVQQKHAGAELFRQSDRDFVTSVAVAEQVLRKRGNGVADGMLFRIYKDLAHMYKRFNHYEPDEIYNWIRLTENELANYAGRMTSMLKSALDEPTFNHVIRRLTDTGFTMRTHEKIFFTNARIPAAWVLIAEKAAT